MYSIITAVPMRLGWFFRLKPTVRWLLEVQKPQIFMAIPTIKYYRTVHT